MPVYAYQTLDRSGRRTRGQSEVGSAGALTRTLQRDGLIVLELNAAEQAALGSGRRVGRTRNVLEFSRACAALLGAGMPVARALATSTLVVPANLAGVIDSVRERVERGASLAEALSDYPAVFSPVFTGVVSSPPLNITRRCPPV